jgi:REP element-mobilizing transposase RayT
MATYKQIIYHLIFSTKHRRPTLTADRRDELYKYIWGVLRNKGCHLYRIGGVEDHVHLLTSLHPSVALADIIKDMKNSTSAWIKAGNIFPRFSHWHGGYSAFTHSIQERDDLIEYIKNQENHHRKTTFAEE